tara:strand:- start:96 stop:308 length:213 start_codon:yes stop_codon:yes gene_type:complete
MLCYFLIYQKVLRYKMMEQLIRQLQLLLGLNYTLINYIVVKLLQHHHRLQLRKLSYLQHHHLLLLKHQQV